MEMQILVAKAGAFECLSPRCPEAVARPYFAEGVPQDCALWFRGPARIERRFEGGADGDHDALLSLFPSALALTKANVRAVVLRPCEANQISLSLPSPQRQQ